MVLKPWWEFYALEEEEETETRKGPWTVQEDMKLISYIILHGEGRWPFLTKTTGILD